MLLSSVSESTCFFLGALSDMPAVRAFALYAGMALLIDFLMQMTVFVALLSLDMARQESRRYDIICCVRSSKKASSSGSAASSCSESCDGGGIRGETGGEGTLYRVFKVLYAPFLMKEWVRPLVVVIFFGWFCASLAVAPQIEVGLDQEISMPDDSYVLKYFEYLKHFLSVGPPFYIVLNSSSLGFDLTNPVLQNKVCGSSGCDADSLQSQIKQWSKQPDVTYVASPAQSWIDDYFEWLTSSSCCSFNPNTLQVCQSNPIKAKIKKAKPSPASTTASPQRKATSRKPLNHPKVSASAKPEEAEKKDTQPETTPATEDDDEDMFSDFFDDGFFDDDDESDPFGDEEEDGKTEESEDNDSLDKHFRNYDDFYYYDDDSEVPNALAKRAANRYRRDVNRREKKRTCRKCTTVPVGRAAKKRPEPKEFRQHLRWFLEDNPGEICPSAGKAAYR